MVERRPSCGEDFCFLCGDCMACYPDDPCYENTYPGNDQHVWVGEEVDDAGNSNPSPPSPPQEA
jgi:hypothetical protein